MNPEMLAFLIKLFQVVFSSRGIDNFGMNNMKIKRKKITFILYLILSTGLTEDMYNNREK